MAVPPNLDCACGGIVHPDQPNVIDQNGVLWHNDEDEGLHRVNPPKDKHGNTIQMCTSPGCVLAADHIAMGKDHAERRMSQLACPHNVPNFGPPCPICDKR